MPSFHYKAIKNTGDTVEGNVDADNIAQAEDIIASRGLIPSALTPRRVGTLGGKKKIVLFGKVKTTDLILFTKQFRTMLHAGIPVVKSIQVLEQQTESLQLQKVLAIIAVDLRQGMSLFASFSKHKHVFSDLYCNMLRTGEYSGNLPAILDRLSYIIQHEYKVRKDISSAMTYPMIVSVMLFGSFLFLLTTVVPKFVMIFRQAKLTLPWPTKLCLTLYELLANDWPLVLIGAGAIFGGLFVFLRTPQGKYVRDALLLRLPLLGPVFQKGAMSRFASIFSILQSSGVPILETIDIISGTIGNAAIAREFDNLRDKIKEGHGLAEPLKSSRYFPPMVINMIVIGEESGNLDIMLKEVSDHYDYEVSHSISRMSELIGPVLMLCMAAVVGFFALAIFLPMWDLTNMVNM